MIKFARKIEIIGLIRERNESLILKDTLDHLSQFVDGIILFDDASTDNSLDIARHHPFIIKIIANKRWQNNYRELEETKHRQLLLEAAQEYHPEWLFYMDADERFEGKIREFLLSCDKKIDGIRISLFDAYMTPEDYEPYYGGELFNFRKYFGPEKREILMIWRNKPQIKFKGLDAREPVVKGKIITKFYCQHYGKALSIKHWEETCNFYSKYFRKYSEKWTGRKGKAIHVKSDFNRRLYTWQEVKKNAVLIYRYTPPTLVNAIKNKFLNLIKK